jgi:hypothetical protein
MPRRSGPPELPRFREEGCLGVIVLIVVICLGAPWLPYVAQAIGGAS